MSRILVANDARTVHAEIVQDDDGHVTGACEAGDWTTEPGRVDQFEDVVQDAAIHMDGAHR